MINVSKIVEELGDMANTKEAKSVKSYFNEVAEIFCHQYTAQPPFQERLHILKRLLEKYVSCLDQNDLCLDVGCGNGLLSRIIAHRQKRVIGIDQSERMISMAQQVSREEQITSHIEYINDSVPLSEEMAEEYKGKVSLIVCSSVLEYVNDYELVLKQFHESLKNDGVLIISLPNSLSVYRLYERLLKKTSLLSNNSYLRFQRHQFNPLRIRRNLAKFQFDVLEEEFFGLPWHQYTSRILGRYRGKWIATMFIMVVQKKTNLKY